MPARWILPVNLRGLIARAFGRTDAGRHEQSAAETLAKEPDVPVLDISVFNELHATLGANTERVHNVYAKFLDSAVKRIDDLRQQPIAASLKTLHTLKGSAGMVGASRLAALAAHLHETTADREALTSAANDIECELAKFSGALRAQLDSASRMR